MKIQTRGFKNKILIDYVRSASEFFIDHLITPKLSDRLDIKIVLKKISEADGLCIKQDKYKYLIELNKNLNFENLLITLAHEIVHVKQYVTMELKVWNILGKDVDVWRGRRFRNLNYDDQPWEMEATDLEVYLFQDFVMHSLLGRTTDIFFSDINTLSPARRTAS